MTFDEKLAQALRNTEKERVEKMFAVEKKHRFSPAYRLWKYKTLRDLRKKRLDNRWTLRRARHIVAAAVAASTLLIGATAYAAAVAIGRYGFVDKRDYSKLLIEAYPSDKTYFEEYYGLPEEDGWETEDCSVLTEAVILNYKRGEKNIYFVQKLINEEAVTNINTEKAQVEMLSLYSENDGFVLDFGSGVALFWVYDGYLLEIVGNLNKSEATNLAYSTKIIDLEKFLGKMCYERGS